MPKPCKNLQNKLKDFDFWSFKAPILRKTIIPSMAQPIGVPKLQMRYKLIQIGINFVKKRQLYILALS